ncbi:hypothetical protein FB451DRAFT_1032222, partial [Mycena latifolia]
ACTGIHLIFPPGQNQHLSYPFGLHSEYDIPWDYPSEGGRLILRSTSRKRVQSSEPGMYRRCDDLDRRNDFLYEIRGRIANGVDENTPFIFFPIGGLIQKLRKKDGQLRAMRLTKLNDTRMLAGKIVEINLHKHLMISHCGQRCAPGVTAASRRDQQWREDPSYARAVL